MRRLVILIGILALALGAAACGGGGSGDGNGNGSSDSASLSLAYETNFKYSPIELSAPAGEITISLKNNDPSLAHNFVIPELNVDSGETDPGRSHKLTFTAVAGTYQYICNIAGHQESGMVGTLTIS